MAKAVSYETAFVKHYQIITTSVANITGIRAICFIRELNAQPARHNVKQM